MDTPLPPLRLEATPRRRKGRGFLRSWKTTIVGAVVLLAAIAPHLPGMPPWVGEAAKAAVPALAGLGFVLTKDADKTGTPS